MNQTKRRRNVYAVKRLRLLQFLLERGFEPVAERPDVENVNYKNWLFVKTPDFCKALDEYFSEVIGSR